MAVNTEETAKKLIYLPKEMVDEIAEYRFNNRINSEAEAIRLLIQKGYDL